MMKRYNFAVGFYHEEFHYDTFKGSHPAFKAGGREKINVHC